MRSASSHVKTMNPAAELRRSVRRRRTTTIRFKFGIVEFDDPAKSVVQELAGSGRGVSLLVGHWGLLAGGLGWRVAFHVLRVYGVSGRPLCIL